MTIYNLGSINIDRVYTVPHLPRPGETLAGLRLRSGLGGKGANQSVAAARMGAEVHHLGAVGPEGRWTIDRLAELGVRVEGVMVADVATGHAIIQVDEAGENAIVIFPGANVALTAGYVEAALARARARDMLLLQNETAEQATAARLAHGRGLRVVYSAAPFSVQAVRAVLPHVSLLVMNAVEAGQLAAALGHPVADLPVADMVVTRGAEGAVWLRDGAVLCEVAAHPVQVADSTGAGDCFTGTLAACLDEGGAPEEAMRLAAAAAAIQVTRPGASEAMPTRAEVEAFLAVGAAAPG